MNPATSPMIRFAELLPKSGDLELSLLKSHLLIEEALTTIICSAAQQPKYIERARLTFAQKISLARSFSALENEPWVWGALNKLNDARNELGHRLAMVEIRAKLDDFVNFVESEQGAPHASLLGGTFAPFHWAAASVFTLLAAQSNLSPVDMTGNADAVGGIEGLDGK